MTAQPTIDENKLDEFVGRFVADMGAAMHASTVLIGDKLGDNAQARALADALGWPYEVRQVLPKPEWVLGKPRFEARLDHLDLAAHETGHHAHVQPARR